MRAAIARLDAAVAWVEGLALGLLVLAMTGVTLSQVFWRYALNAPLIWSEEAARYLFVWVALVGAGLAMRLPASALRAQQTLADMMMAIVEGEGASDDEEQVFTSQEQADRIAQVQLRKAQGLPAQAIYHSGLVRAIHQGANVPMLSGWLKGMPNNALKPAKFNDSVDKCHAFYAAFDEITNPANDRYYNPKIAPTWIAYAEHQMPPRPRHKAPYSLFAPAAFLALHPNLPHKHIFPLWTTNTVIVRTPPSREIEIVHRYASDNDATLTLSKCQCTDSVAPSQKHTTAE